MVVAAPVTEKTTGLFNEERLRKMKRGACLFNVGRGIQVDSAALARVIREGHLAGAGLDVVEKEPLPPDSPLWDVPEILITPHVAGFDYGSGSTNSTRRTCAAILPGNRCSD